MDLLRIESILGGFCFIWVADGDKGDRPEIEGRESKRRQCAQGQHQAGQVSVLSESFKQGVKTAHDLIIVPKSPATIRPHPQERLQPRFITPA